jgi:lipopolysaccharide export system permease protein
LLGIFIDDQRDPKDRMTILAEQGRDRQKRRQRLSRARARQLQRHETGTRDPTLVLFDSYAFDLSKAAAGPKNIKYSTRERYLWELASPIPGDPLFADQPGQVRAEFHDRLTAPLYPLAFVFVTYAYLGAPRTTRQGRTTSLLGAIGAISALRGIGFAGMIGGGASRSCWCCLPRPHRRLRAGLSQHLRAIVMSRGFITEAIGKLISAFRRAGSLVGQTP